MSQALPLLSAHLEEGPALWRHLQEILLGPHAGNTLRAMHALGILELLIPEFHGIDALVIRDAYHRYTVDEHTMVLIDTLHGLETPQTGPMGEWAGRFGGILRDVQHQALLYLGALMHDTGKGRSTDDHARRERTHGGERGGAAGTGCVRERAAAGTDSQPSGDVGGAAAGHLRSGDGERVCGQGADPRGVAHADAVYLRGHSRGASGRADAVEGGEPVAAVSGHGKLPGPQRGR